MALLAARQELESGTPLHLMRVEARLLALVGDGNCGKSALAWRIVGPSLTSPQRRGRNFGGDRELHGTPDMLLPPCDRSMFEMEHVPSFPPPVSLSMCAGQHGIAVGHGVDSDSAAAEATRLLQVYDAARPWGHQGVAADVEALLPAFMCPGSVVVWHSRAADARGTCGHAVLQPLFLACTAARLFRVGCLDMPAACRGAGAAQAPSALIVVLRDADDHLAQEFVRHSRRSRGGATSQRGSSAAAAAAAAQEFLFDREDEASGVGAAMRNRMRAVIAAHFASRISVHLMPPATSDIASVEAAERGLLMDCIMCAASHLHETQLPTTLDLCQLLGALAAAVPVEALPLLQMSALIPPGGTNEVDLASQASANLALTLFALLRQEIRKLVSAADPEQLARDRLVEDAQAVVIRLAASFRSSQQSAKESFIRSAQSRCEAEVDDALRVNRQRRIALLRTAARDQCRVLEERLQSILHARQDAQLIHH